MDAGFLNVVEFGQYFMTKDTAEFSQFHAVACREDTLPRDEEAGPGGWGPQGRRSTGGGGLARVPNLRVCEHPLDWRVAHAGDEG